MTRHRSSLLLFAAVVGFALLAGCGTRARDSAAPGEQVAASQGGEETGGSTQEAPERKRGWLERTRSRDATVIHCDDELEKRAAFGTLLQLQPPTANMLACR